LALTEVLGTVALGPGETGFDETVAEMDRPHRARPACFAARIERA
jgi:hypothetical protein